MCYMVPLDLLQLKHMVSDVDMKGGDAELFENCMPMTLSLLSSLMSDRPKIQNTHKNFSKVLLTFPRDI